MGSNFTQKEMDGNNVHTSVVIELANQEESEGQKMYKIDFDDVEPPKDYVIDQIFCGENITIYALFEISDVTNKQSKKQLVEVTNSSTNEDCRFYRTNSYKHAVNEKRLESCRRHVSIVDSDEDFDLLPTKDHRNESFYCLKHFGDTYEIGSQLKDSTGLQVLYSKDFVSKTPKSTKFKAVSKGVNTDIAQCPKLLEEVQQALSLNFPCCKGDGKTVEFTSFPSFKQSFEMIEIDGKQSGSSFGSDVETKKYTHKSMPNFLLVPIFVMEEGILNQHKKEEKSLKIIGKKKSVSGTCITNEKTSLGVNTDFSGDESVFFVKEDKITGDIEEISHVNDQKSNGSQTEKNENHSQEHETSESNCQSKVSNKKTILQEIKDLQWKLNSLIKSLEFDEFDLELNVQKEVLHSESETQKKTEETKEAVKKIDNPESSSELKIESAKKSQKKFDDLPIFSSVNCSLTKSSSQKTKKKSFVHDRIERKEIPLSPAKSTASSMSWYTSSIIHTFCDQDAPNLELKNVETEISLKWDHLLTSKRIGASKSEILVLEQKHTGSHSVKKSLSLDLKDVKLEASSIKKIKNTPLKQEGGLKLKSSLRIYPPGENSFPDNLTSLKCEMGDEAAKKLKTSAIDLADLTNLPAKDKEVLGVIIKDNFDIKPRKEEEGDAKILFQKNKLTTTKFIQNTEKVSVHYCTNTNAPLESCTKGEKTSGVNRTKSRSVDKSIERNPKVTSDSEKPVTPNKGCRKLNSSESNVKKETKANKKPNKVTEKSNKCEKKETFADSPKVKSVTGCRKASEKGNADSKLHVDRLIDQTSKKHLESNFHSKSEKQNRNDSNARLSRPPSQKRDRRELTPAAPQTFHKEVGSTISQKEPLVLVQVESTQLSKNASPSDLHENIGHIMVVESEENSCVGLVDTAPTENEVQLSSHNPSSVVVELFSKKPESIDGFYSEVDQECMYLEKNTLDELNGEKNIKECSSCNGTNGNPEKPIVKSVWALTKVLLYEDGTKKFEVLEASLTPPEYSLKNDRGPDDKNR